MFFINLETLNTAITMFFILRVKTHEMETVSNAKIVIPGFNRRDCKIHTIERYTQT